MDYEEFLAAHAVVERNCRKANEDRNLAKQECDEATKQYLDNQERLKTAPESDREKWSRQVKESGERATNAENTLHKSDERRDAAWTARAELEWKERDNDDLRRDNLTREPDSAVKTAMREGGESLKAGGRAAAQQAVGYAVGKVTDIDLDPVKFANPELLNDLKTLATQQVDYVRHVILPEAIEKAKEIPGALERKSDAEIDKLAKDSPDQSKSADNVELQRIKDADLAKAPKQVTVAPPSEPGTRPELLQAQKYDDFNKNARDVTERKAPPPPSDPGAKPVDADKGPPKQPSNDPKGPGASNDAKAANLTQDPKTQSAPQDPKVPEIGGKPAKPQAPMPAPQDDVKPASPTSAAKSGPRKGLDDDL
jgi:hypothetical protein